MDKDELLAEAALILEQEGWLLERMYRETSSARIRSFNDRYKAWQRKVVEARLQGPLEATGMWPEPPDNS
jgi:hypothetical protein